MNCSPVVSQYVAIGAIENKNEIIPEYLLKYWKQRDLIEGHLQSMGDVVEFTRLSSAYFFFSRIKGIDDSKKFCLNMLYDGGLAAVPGSKFGPGGEGYIGLCFGRSEEEIKEGVLRDGEVSFKNQRPPLRTVWD